tara:strand:+ start:423 stop:1304 length:882 start_codon:yes stop_codon:yes gene_type:complete
MQKRMFTSFFLAVGIFSQAANAEPFNFDFVGDNIFVAGSHGQRLGQIVLGSEANISGSVIASHYLGLGAGVNISGDACSGYVSQSPSANVEGAAGCSVDSGIGAMIAELSDSLLDYDASRTNVTESLTFDASQNIYNVDSLLLDPQESLTISGGANDWVVVNVYGQAKMGSGAAIKLEGGITSNNVIFNFAQSWTYREFNIGGVEINGTFLSGGRDYILGDGATLDDTRFVTNGAIIANVQDVDYVGAPQFEDGDYVNVPLNGAAVVLLMGAGALLYRRKQQKCCFNGVDLVV